MSATNRKIKIAIYYRDLPQSVVLHIQSDGFMSLVKDGAKKGLGHSCPRATIYMTCLTPSKDTARLQALQLLLDGLLSNNQIVDYSVVKIGRATS